MSYARLSNSGTEENPTSAQPAPTPRMEQAAGTPAASSPSDAAANPGNSGNSNGGSASAAGGGAMASDVPLGTNINGQTGIGAYNPFPGLMPFFSGGQTLGGGPGPGGGGGPNGGGPNGGGGIGPGTGVTAQQHAQHGDTGGGGINSGSQNESGVPDAPPAAIPGDTPDNNAPLTGSEVSPSPTAAPQPPTTTPQSPSSPTDDGGPGDAIVGAGEGGTSWDDDRPGNRIIGADDDPGASASWDDGPATGGVFNYVWNAVPQALKGDYTPDNERNALGTGGEIAVGFFPIVGSVASARDLVQNLTNWEWSWGHGAKTLINAVGLIPEAKGLIGLAKGAGEASQAARGANKLVGVVAEAEQATAKTLGKVDDVGDLAKNTGVARNTLASTAEGTPMDPALFQKIKRAFEKSERWYKNN